MKRILARLVLLFATLSIVLIVFEVGSRLFGLQPVYEIYSRSSLFWRHDPVLGWSHQPDSGSIYRGPSPWPIEFENEIQINSHGLRGVEPGNRGEGAHRILFLGDSMIAGFEVAEDETFVVRVQKKLDARLPALRVETINAGVRGYGTDQSLLYYRRSGRELKPDLVIFHHSPNDIRNNMTLHRMRRPFGKGVFAVDADGTLREQGIPVPEYPLCSAVMMDSHYEVVRLDTPAARTACGLEMFLTDRSAFFTYVTQVLQRTPTVIRWLHRLGSGTREVARTGAGILLPGVANADPRDDAAIVLTRALIVALAREVRSDGAEFLLWISTPALREIGRWEIETAGINVIHTEMPMALVGPFPTSFKNDGHWTAFGHRLVGDMLVASLLKRFEQARAGETTK